MGRRWIWVACVLALAPACGSASSAGSDDGGGTLATASTPIDAQADRAWVKAAKLVPSDLPGSNWRRAKPLASPAPEDSKTEECHSGTDDLPLSAGSWDSNLDGLTHARSSAFAVRWGAVVLRTERDARTALRRLTAPEYTACNTLRIRNQRIEGVEVDSVLTTPVMLDGLADEVGGVRIRVVYCFCDGRDSAVRYYELLTVRDGRRLAVLYLQSADRPWAEEYERRVVETLLRRGAEGARKAH